MKGKAQLPMLVKLMEYSSFEMILSIIIISIYLYDGFLSYYFINYLKVNIENLKRKDFQEDFLFLMIFV